MPHATIISNTRNSNGNNNNDDDDNVSLRQQQEASLAKRHLQHTHTYSQTTHSKGTGPQTHGSLFKLGKRHSHDEMRMLTIATTSLSFANLRCTLRMLISASGICGRECVCCTGVECGCQPPRQIFTPKTQLVTIIVATTTQSFP